MRKLILLGICFIVILTSCTMKTETIQEEESAGGFREIVIQGPTPTVTPTIDFDLTHLSIIRKENDSDESRIISTGEFAEDFTGVEAVEPVDEQDSGVFDESSSSDIGHDYYGEPVPELVESELSAEESHDAEYENEDNGQYESESGNYGGTIEGTGEGTNGLGGTSEEDSEISGDNGSEETRLTYLGDWTITAYCPCEICCGEYSSGYTASGTLATAGRTIACNILPIGTQVMIDDCIYTVEDTGWSPYEQWVDIFFNTHDEALAFGMRTMEVYLVE